MRHGLQAHLHEKPFAGINGSGKHCNWSLAIASDNELDGINLLKPGQDAAPEPALPAVPCRGAQGRAQARRPAARRHRHVSGNEHRLGANEAPPAIISVFLGSMLTQRHRGHRRRQDAGEARPSRRCSSSASTSCPRSCRTTPTATAPRRSPSPARSSSSAPWASSQSIAFPVMLLQRRGRRGDRRDHRRRSRRSSRRPRRIDDAVLKVVREAFKEHDGRSASRATTTPTPGCMEAKKRGLLNLRRTPEALAEMVSEPLARRSSTHTGILTKPELESRYHIRLERYRRTCSSRCTRCARWSTRRSCRPATRTSATSPVTRAAAARRASTCSRSSTRPTRSSNQVTALQKARTELGKALDEGRRACTTTSWRRASSSPPAGREAMDAVRAACDALELTVGDDVLAAAAVPRDALPGVSGPRHPAVAGGRRQSRTRRDSPESRRVRRLQPLRGRHARATGADVRVSAPGSPRSHAASKRSTTLPGCAAVNSAPHTATPAAPASRQRRALSACTPPSATTGRPLDRASAPIASTPMGATSGLLRVANTGASSR